MIMMMIIPFDAQGSTVHGGIIGEINNHSHKVAHKGHTHAGAMRHKASKSVPASSAHTEHAPSESPAKRFPWHSTVILIVGILLGKLHSQIANQVSGIIHEILPQCKLGQICAWYEKRPYLEDGRLSSAEWDVPRKHLTSNYSAIHLLRRGASVKMQSQYPRVFWISAVLDDSEAQLLTNEAERALAEQVFGENDVEETTIHVGKMHSSVAQLVEKIVRLIGLPSRRYVDELVFRRYNSHTHLKSQTPWCHNGRAVATAPPFEGCGCAAVAQLTLASPEHGGAHVISSDTDDGHRSDEMRVTAQAGDMLAWFIMHPMTETVQRIIHRIQPVQQGTKLVAELHIRNCSWHKNHARSDGEEILRMEGRKSTSGSRNMQESHNNPDPVDNDERGMLSVAYEEWRAEPKEEDIDSVREAVSPDGTD